MTDIAPPVAPAPLQVVQPEPVPISWLARVLPSPQGLLISLEAFTPVGRAVYLLDAEGAQTVRDLLDKVIPQARSGLVIPDAPLKIGP
jgi:hypothetical protein